MTHRRFLPCHAVAAALAATLLAVPFVLAQAPPAGGVPQGGPGPGSSFGYQQPGGPSGAPPQAGAAPHDGAAPQGGVQPFAGPQQPITPSTPGAHRVPRPPVMRYAPFQLTKEQFQELTAVLAAWEQSSSKVDLMRCTLELLEYDLAFVQANQAAKPNMIWNGHLMYQAPDHGLFEAKSDAKSGEQLQKWVVDGKSVYHFDAQGKKVIRRDLPPELQGKGIGDGPLPFFFGAPANKLLHRYFMRLVTPPNVADKQIWIEAYPRFQGDAANFRRATVILDRSMLVPQAVEVYSPSGNERQVYKFSQMQIGRNLLEKLFNKDLFQVQVPSGWQLLANPGANAPHAAASQLPGTARSPHVMRR